MGKVFLLMKGGIMKLIKNIFILFILVILFTGCKKYPENTLWFKNPKNIHPIQGHITKYMVNGIDSLDLMNAYFGNCSGIKKDLRNAYITYDDPHGYASRIYFGTSGCSSSTGISFFSKNKKYCKIDNVIDTSILKRKLFLDVDWKIIRLAETGPFKIETTLTNGNKYEIQFN